MLQRYSFRVYPTYGFGLVAPDNEGKFAKVVDVDQAIQAAVRQAREECAQAILALRDAKNGPEANIALDFAAKVARGAVTVGGNGNGKSNGNGTRPMAVVPSIPTALPSPAPPEGDDDRAGYDSAEEDGSLHDGA